jgi:hypothetical protein
MDASRIKEVLGDGEMRFSLACFAREAPRFVLLEPIKAGGEPAGSYALAIDQGTTT